MWMLLAAALTTTATPAQRVAVMPTRAGPGASPDMAQLMDVRLGTSLTRHARLGTIITSEDLTRLTILDTQRRALGCTEDTCAKELGAAFETSHVLTSTVSVLDDTLLVTATYVPVDGGSVVRLEERGPNSAEDLLAAVDRLVARLEALAAPPPPPPPPNPTQPTPPAPKTAALPHHLMGVVGAITSGAACALSPVACSPLLLACASLAWGGSLVTLGGACGTCFPLGVILMLVGMMASLPVTVAGFLTDQDNLTTIRAAAGVVLAAGGALGAAGILTLVVGAVTTLGSTAYLMGVDGLTALQNADPASGALPAFIRIPTTFYLVGVAACLLGACAIPPALWFLGMGGLGLGGSLVPRQTAGGLEPEDDQPRKKKKKSKKRKKHVLDEDDVED